MADIFTIQLTIGSRTFSIQVPRDSEQIYRDAAKMINTKLQQYISSFPDQKKEDYMAMVMLDIAVSLVRESNVDKRLRTMIDQVEQALESQ